MREGLNASRPQCPVGLTTLRFPSQLEVRLLLMLFSCTVKTFETNQHSLKSHAKGEHCRLDPRLKRYLNSNLPIGQVTFKFCLPGALHRLPKFLNSLIIHEHKNGSQTTGTPVVLLVLITLMFTYFLVPVLHTGYLRYDTALSQFVQFVKDLVRLLECSPASWLAPRNHCEQKCEKFITCIINNRSPSDFSFDTCRRSVEV